MKKNKYLLLKYIAPAILWCLTGAWVSAQTTPRLTTDQSDYMPGTIVTLHGRGFYSNESISIVVNHATGGDDATSPAHLPFSATASEDGEFTAQWYVPSDEDEDGALLVATALGLTSQWMAQVYFTDNLNIDFRQGANNDAGYGPGAIHWISSILQQSNSTFTEGMSTLQRVMMADIPATTGNIHSLRISHQFTKGGHYAYDFLTGNSLNASIGWNVAFSDYNDYLIANDVEPESILEPYACGDEIGPPANLSAICASLHDPATSYSFDVELPDDPFISVHGPVQSKIDIYESSNGNRYARLYGNAPIINAYFTCVQHDVANGGDTSDSNVYYTLIVETASTNMILEFGGHLAIAGVANEDLSWGPDHGAGNISGGPYHFRLHGMGGAVDATTCEMSEFISLGSQDNQIKAGDIIPLVCDCAVSGEVGPVCPNSTNTYCAPDSAASVIWSIVGNGVLVGTGNCIEVTAGDTCGASYTVMLHVTYDNGCTSDCSIQVMVQDTVAPVIDELPAESTIDCPAVPEFTQATASDACDDEVNLAFEDEFIAGNCPGNYTIVRTWTATDDCGNASSASQTINVQDVTAPVIDELPAESTIDCPAVPEFAQATASDACDEEVDLAFEDEFIAGNCPGNYSIIRSWTATDDCGNTSSASQTINVQDITSPVIDELPAESTIDCPAVPEFAQATASDACDEEVDLAFEDEFIAGNCPGNYSIIRTWTATDDCGNASSASQTINVQDVTPPIIECPYDITAGDCDETNICLAQASDACDGDDLIIQYNYACDYDFPEGEHVVVATTTDACGNQASCNFTVTIVGNPECNLEAPNTLPAAGSTNNMLCVMEDYEVTYAWSVIGSGWQITGGSNSPCVTYTAGPVGVEATFSLIVTNGFGCSDTCYVSFSSVGNQFCTYTQGFYGGNGKNCLGVKVVNVISNALSPANGGNLVIGTPSTTRVLTILSSEAICLNSKMPAGTTPANLPLSNGSITCATATGSNYLSNGRFKSVLVGQTIALGLNLRGDIALGSLALAGNKIVTAKASSCINGTPLAYTQREYCIPYKVWNYLSVPKSVNQLYALANQALGGNVPASLTISEISSAVDAVNRAFDQCRILISFGECGNRSEEESDDTAIENGLKITEQSLQLKAYPNPMGESATLEIVSSTDQQAVAEIYSGRGEWIQTVFSGTLNAGESRLIPIQSTHLSNGIYICKLTAGNEVTYATLVVSK